MKDKQMKFIDNPERINFSLVKTNSYYSDFLEIQIKSFQKFLKLDSTYMKRKKEGLYKAFLEYFPISDYKSQFILEFIDYLIDPPRYSLEECLQRGLTYSVSIKVRLKFYCTNPEYSTFETVYQDIYIGSCPYMTPTGSFIFNGSERVIVSQLQKSPGIFFGQYSHPNGKHLAYAKLIPYKGVCMEFSIDINNVLSVSIDQSKKFPITTLLRAIGYSKDQDILNIFELADKFILTKKNSNQLLGKYMAANILKTSFEDWIDEKTGELISLEKNEIILNRNIFLKKNHIKKLLQCQIQEIYFYKNKKDSIIHNTLQKDPTNYKKEALDFIYKQVKNCDPPSHSYSKELMNKLIFSEINYSLGEVGRYKLNKTLKVDIPLTYNILSKEDLISIIEHLIELNNSTKEIEDIDHLSNRRVKTVGEQLYTQYGLGIAKIARIIKEKINLKKKISITPLELIKAKTLTSVINTFFGTNPLSQFMDQTNPLAEITHKRRLSSLGQGGILRERAGFEVRDVNSSHYGRLCPIETPEGPNIGLISSLCVFAKINSMGFIETPYLRVKDGKVLLKKKPLYLSAEQETGKLIAQANAIFNHKTGELKPKLIVREDSDFTLVNYKKVDYIDISTNQIASISASLIPFIEHDDANRALMGSNMMRQAVPLLNPQVPIVGTGLEKHLAYDSRMLIYAEADGIVDSVSANVIKIKYFLSETEKLLSFEKRIKKYKLIKFRKTNQNTCINLRPIVKKGMKVVKNKVLCEGYATKNGELALGINLKVAFMPFKGYNFEDAIVISEKVLREDWFTSIHIDEYSIEIRDTQFGMEELTNDLPNFNEEDIKNLDENGMIRIGSKVKPGDIIIGKLTPKIDKNPSPEKKLLKAIFGERAVNIKNVSLKADPSLFGVVIDKKLYSRSENTEEYKIKKHFKLEKLNFSFKKNLDKLKDLLIKKLHSILEGTISEGVRNSSNKEIILKGKKITLKVLKTIDNFSNIISPNWVKENLKNKLVLKLINNFNLKKNQLKIKLKKKQTRILIGDELPPGVFKLAKVFIAKKRKLKVGDKMSGRHGNKGIVAIILKEEDMPYLEDGTPIDLVLNPLGVPSRMNIGQIYETILGWAGEKLGRNFSTPIFDGASLDEISKYTDKANLPRFGNTYLFDGETGEKFEQPVTVGVIYMLKLNHMVDDKLHARSIGPYSLITQQPLGGKSQFGGQRFGEMEVWALESFGAANILREIITIKSDDVIGRANTFEAIVKGKKLPIPGVPESFNVLISELKGLGLNLSLEEEEEEEED
ncbi:MAG: DNA-directed RNA polymerase subunit beta [Candidatus Karelsulcia muelleri]